MTGRLSEVGWRPRVVLSPRVVSLVLWRKIGLMNHDELQRRLQVAWQAVVVRGNMAPMNRFEAMLLPRVRRNLRSCLDLMVERRMDAVLATAAAEEYAAALGRRLGFRHILATRSGRVASEPANAGPAKRLRVADFLRGIGWYDRPRILFTDHIDDLPLIRDCNGVCWFGSVDSLSVVRTMVNDTRFIHCRDMGNERLLATFRSLCGYSLPTPAARCACPLSEITVSSIAVSSIMCWWGSDGLAQ
jgi:hypothetical protein